tara:strand:+ start:5082 stop:5258 length:177 start_codon:yes stop_codon:yes gene_type:complete
LQKEEKCKMDIADLKLLGINSIALAITMTEIEITLKVVLLLVTIGYTLSKWIQLKRKK